MMRHVSMLCTAVSEEWVLLGIVFNMLLTLYGDQTNVR